MLKGRGLREREGKEVGEGDDSLGRGDWLVDREREGWEAISTRVEMVDVEL
jgi:hypothetical protein